MKAGPQIHEQQQVALQPLAANAQHGHGAGDGQAHGNQAAAQREGKAVAQSPHGLAALEKLPVLQQRKTPDAACLKAGQDQIKQGDAQQQYDKHKENRKRDNGKAVIPHPFQPFLHRHPPFRLYHFRMEPDRISAIGRAQRTLPVKTCLYNIRSHLCRHVKDYSVKSEQKVK